MNALTRLRDPSLLLETNVTIQCAELITHQDDEGDEDSDDLPIIFLCTIAAETMSKAATAKCCDPTSTNECPPGKLTLRFGCRRPSFDSVLNKGEQSVTNFDDSAVDPNLFDSGYTLAGSTGFCVWAGARFLLEAMLSDRALALQVAGMRIIELGSGVGMLGTALAALGGEVLLTDLPTLVDHAIVPNLYRNTSSETTSFELSTWLGTVAGCESSVHRIGLGWATAKPLDWTKELTNQFSVETLQQIDMVVATDCTWLASLLCHFFDTLSKLFDHGTSKCLLSFRRRECNVGSALFTTTASLIDEIRDKRSWNVRLLAWRPLEQADDNLTDVCLIEISP